MDGMWAMSLTTKVPILKLVGLWKGWTWCKFDWTAVMWFIKVMLWSSVFEELLTSQPRPYKNVECSFCGLMKLTLPSAGSCSCVYVRRVCSYLPFFSSHNYVCHVRMSATLWMNNCPKLWVSIPSYCTSPLSSIAGFSPRRLRTAEVQKNFFWAFRWCKL